MTCGTAGAPDQRELLAHELHLMRLAHPVAFDLVDRLLRGQPARRVPGLGVLVADPTLVREVLTDRAYRKDGPGSSGALWSGVLGHRTLIGMDGPPHRALRRALGQLFTPQAAAQVCERVLGAPLAQLTDDLVCGRSVDVVQVTRLAATSVIATLVGMADEETDLPRQQQAAEQLLRVSDGVLGMVRFGTRRLSPAQNRQLRALFAPVAESAAAAYDRAVRNGAAGSDSVLARLPALGISRSQAPALAAVLLLTGTETMASAAPRTVAMLHDSGMLAELSARAPGESRRAALTPFIAEALRLATPSPAMLRRVPASRGSGRSGCAAASGCCSPPGGPPVSPAGSSRGAPARPRCGTCGSARDRTPVWARPWRWLSWRRSPGPCWTPNVPSVASGWCSARGPAGCWCPPTVGWC